LPNFELIIDIIVYALPPDYQNMLKLTEARHLCPEKVDQKTDVLFKNVINAIMR